MGSLSARLMRAVSSVGRGGFAVSTALKNAILKELAIPSTSPVERITAPGPGEKRGAAKRRPGGAEDVAREHSGWLA
jgi:hypothetical protein